MSHHPNLTSFTVYFWLHRFLPFLFISSFSRTQTSGSLTLPLKTGSIASSLLPLTIEKLRAYWGGELSRCLLTSWSSIQTGRERERGGEQSRERSDYWCSSNPCCVSQCCGEQSSNNSSSSSVRHVSLSRESITQKSRMGKLSGWARGGSERAI